MAAELRLPANAAAHHGDICETIGICGIWGGLGRYLEAVGHGRESTGQTLVQCKTVAYRGLEVLRGLV
eukprot:scaffold200_cov50-Cyclotella_meneghiniana.AAC.3